MNNEDMINFLHKYANEGKLVLSTVEGLQTVPLLEFIEQPTTGILYDLNRGIETTNVFIREGGDTLPKIRLINDYAVALVITALKNKIKQLEGTE